MKHTSIVLAVLWLSLQGCVENDKSPQQGTITTTETPSAKNNRPSRKLPLPPTELAASLGISAENYPYIDGSTATLPLVQAIYGSMFQWGYHDEEEYVILADGNEILRRVEYPGLPRAASQTAALYEKLITGEVDLILVSDPSDDAKQQAVAAGVALDYIPIGVEALVFITAGTNPAESVTVEQLLNIYTDMTVTNWADLGGKDGPIIALVRNKDSGSHALMANLVLRGKAVHPDIQTRRTANKIGLNLEQIYGVHINDDENNIHTLGYTRFHYFMHGLEENIVDFGNRYRVNIKALAVDGVMPSLETILSRKYTLSVGTFAVIRGDEPADSPARKIVEWLLGDDGQRVVRGSGLGVLRSVAYKPLR